jgi:hypothetical protein
MSTSKVRIQDFLSRVPLFNELATDELDNIAAGTTEVHAARGDMVFHRRDPCVQVRSGRSVFC